MTTRQHARLLEAIAGVTLCPADYETEGTLKRAMGVLRPLDYNGATANVELFRCSLLARARKATRRLSGRKDP